MYDFIVNPHACGGKGKKTFEKLRAYLEKNRIAYSVSFTEHTGHAKELAKKLAETGTRNLVVVGGDGTIHEVINGVERLNDVKIGIIPAGTGNDYALPLGIPKDPVKAFKIVEKGNTKHVDLMLTEGKRVICFATSGLDVPLVEACNRLKRKRKTSYLRMLLRELRRDITYTFKVTANGKTETLDAFFVGFTSTGIIAAGMKLCPTAKYDDGILDFVAIKKLKKRSFPRLVWNLYRGNILSRDCVLHITGTEILVEPITLNAVDLDGELYYNHNLHVTVVPKALELFI